MGSLADRGGAALAWGVIAVAVCAAVIPLEPSVLEEGVILHFAQRMVRGEHLYRDLVFYSGPLPFELLALLFRVFGEQVAVGRWAVALLGGAACATVYADARRSGAGALSHVAAAGFAAAPVLLFPLLSTYFYTTLALSLAVLAAGAALRGLTDGRFAFAAGVLASLVALCKQNVGVVLGPGLLVVVALYAPPPRRRRQLAWLLGGALATVLATLAVYGLRGDLGLLVSALVWMPLRLGESFGSPYPNLWPLGALDPQLPAHFYIPHLINVLPPESGFLAPWHVAVTQLLYALPFVALAALVLRRALAGPLPPGLAGGAVVLLALLAQLFPRSDWGHLVFVLPPAVSVLALCAGAPADGRAGRWRAALATALVGVAGAGVLGIALALHRAAGHASFGDRAPERALSPMYRRDDFRRAVDFLRARVAPGEPIFVARAEPLLYFATDTTNPTPYPGIIPGLGAEQDRAIVEALARVRYVAMSERDSDEFFFYRDVLPETQRYLERHFRVPEAFADVWTLMIVLERGPDRGPTAVDLFDAAAGAHAWVEDAGGSRRDVAAGVPRLVTSRNRRPLPVALGAAGGGVDFEVAVPPGGVLQTDLGLRFLPAGAVLLEHVPAFRFEVLVGTGGAFELVGSRDLVLDEASATRWTPFEVDLGAFAGQRVTLRLRVVPREPPPPGALAWLGSPRIAVPVEPAEPREPAGRAEPGE